LWAFWAGLASLAGRDGGVGLDSVEGVGRSSGTGVVLAGVVVFRSRIFGDVVVVRAVIIVIFRVVAVVVGGIFAIVIVFVGFSFVVLAFVVLAIVVLVVVVVVILLLLVISVETAVKRVVVLESLDGLAGLGGLYLVDGKSDVLVLAWARVVLAVTEVASDRGVVVEVEGLDVTLEDGLVVGQLTTEKGDTVAVHGGRGGRSHKSLSGDELAVNVKADFGLAAVLVDILDRPGHLVPLAVPGLQLFGLFVDWLELDHLVADDVVDASGLQLLIILEVKLVLLGQVDS